MPLVNVKSPTTTKLILRCINHTDSSPMLLASEHDKAVGDGVDTTMRSASRLIGLSPIDVQQGQVHVDHGVIIPVKLFYCSTCGYVEMYNGQVLDPIAFKVAQ